MRFFHCSLPEMFLKDKSKQKSDFQWCSVGKKVEDTPLFRGMNPSNSIAIPRTHAASFIVLG